MRIVPTRLYGAVVHSSVFLGASTIAEVFVASALAGIGPNVALAVGFLITVGIYNFDKLADLDADEENYAERTAFVAAHPRLYAGFSTLAVVGALWLAVRHGGVYGLGLTLFPGVVAVFYSAPVVPLPSVDRLKDIFLVNTASVSLAWAVLVGFAPLAVAATAPEYAAGAAVAAVWFFLRSAISVEVHNVRDVAGDAQNGVETLPTVIGVRRTQLSLYALELVSVGLVWVAARAGVVPAWAPFALLPAVAYSTWITYALTETDRSIERLCTLRDAEGVLMAVGVAVVAAAVGTGGTLA
ncbi:UbiA family prenyltransferase [Haloferax volcanii]|uniref:UbiA family prenyltransferase n=4 Tax=Halobacteriales TaxID=2235 RepID=D4GSL8_HALVD|nr:UbiA family prenyltransferase [Haloferax volcanii]ADE03241.1 UbiA family prenyltransferase [Haloferax volcanii DS2]ELY26118.1 prenyltransferase [Haloferax volcanii DS2]MBS8119824.1 UbiA family prenyltransferase [Haloferax volcanii]MBS8124836.1 UbiA family prenyltransferase [Haloferax volcanii]MBS8128899.1 UbiA family prenyltransferase [Haloferax volcanii]